MFSWREIENYGPAPSTVGLGKHFASIHHVPGWHHSGLKVGGAGIAYVLPSTDLSFAGTPWGCQARGVAIEQMRGVGQGICMLLFFNSSRNL